MPPRHAGAFTRLADPAGQDGVAEKAGRLVVLAGVHVGLARVAGRVDKELRAALREQVGELVGVRVIDLLAGQVAEGNVQLGKQFLVGEAHVTGAAEKDDHGQKRLGETVWCKRDQSLKPAATAS